MRRDWCEEETGALTQVGTACEGLWLVQQDGCGIPCFPFAIAMRALLYNPEFSCSFSSPGSRSALSARLC